MADFRPFLGIPVAILSPLDLPSRKILKITPQIPPIAEELGHPCFKQFSNISFSTLFQTKIKEFFSLFLCLSIEFQISFISLKYSSKVTFSQQIIIHILVNFPLQRDVKGYNPNIPQSLRSRISLLNCHFCSKLNLNRF